MCLLAHHQRETHHDAGQAEKNRAHRIGWRTGSTGFFFLTIHLLLDTAAGWRLRLTAQRAFLGRTTRIVQQMQRLHDVGQSPWRRRLTERALVGFGLVVRVGA